MRSVTTGRTDPSAERDSSSDGIGRSMRVSWHVTEKCLGGDIGGAAGSLSFSTIPLWGRLGRGVVL